MTSDERTRILAVVVNAAAAVAIVALQDPAVRRDVAELWARLVSKARAVYRHREPSPAEIRAVVDRAEEITREGPSR